MKVKVTITLDGAIWEAPQNPALKDKTSASEIIDELVADLSGSGKKGGKS